MGGVRGKKAKNSSKNIVLSSNSENFSLQNENYRALSNNLPY